MLSALFFPVLTHRAIMTDLVLLAAAKINLMCTYCVYGTYLLANSAAKGILNRHSRRAPPN